MLIIKIGCKGTTNIAYTQIKVKLFSLKVLCSSQWSRDDRGMVAKWSRI